MSTTEDKNLDPREKLQLLAEFALIEAKASPALIATLERHAVKHLNLWHKERTGSHRDLLIAFRLMTIAFRQQKVELGLYEHDFFDIWLEGPQTHHDIYAKHSRWLKAIAAKHRIYLNVE